MLAPGVTVVGIQSVEIIGDRLVLRMMLSDGNIGCTWWSITDDLPRFLTPAIEATPRAIGVSLQ